MAPPDPDSGMAMMLGELRGQVRELVHGMNNVSMKVDGLGREMAVLITMSADMADLKRRVMTIEATAAEQRGASSVLSKLAASPVVGWIVAAIIAVGGFIGWERVTNPQQQAVAPSRVPVGGTP